MNTRAVPDDFDAEAGAGNVWGCAGFRLFFAVADAGDVGLGVLVLALRNSLCKSVFGSEENQRQRTMAMASPGFDQDGAAWPIWFPPTRI